MRTVCFLELMHLSSYDTFGFVDLTALIASERGIKINEAEFDKELKAQIDRSRSAGKISTDDWVSVNEGGSSEFIGTTILPIAVRFYDMKAQVLRARIFIR